MASVFEKYNKRRKKKKRQETGEIDEDRFVARKAFDVLQEEGFRRLITTEILEKRLAQIKTVLNDVLKDLASKSYKTRKGAVDKAHTLVFHISSAWLRSMENEWLTDMMNAFIEQYSDCINIPALLPMLVDEAKMVINKSFAGIDVQTIRPIMIYSFPTRRGENAAELLFGVDSLTTKA